MRMYTCQNRRAHAGEADAHPCYRRRPWPALYNQYKI